MDNTSRSEPLIPSHALDFNYHLQQFFIDHAHDVHLYNK